MNAEKIESLVRDLLIEIGENPLCEGFSHFVSSE